MLYEKYLGSSSVPIPVKEEWIMRDAKVQDNPTTPFGMALKRTVRKDGKESLLSLRDEFVPRFFETLTDLDIQHFTEDVFPLLQSSFQQKDVWLQIAGNLSADRYHLQWTPALTIGEIRGIRFYYKKDIKVSITSDCAYPIQGILRWGRGAGFSNLRLDLK